MKIPSILAGISASMASFASAKTVLSEVDKAALVSPLVKPVTPSVSPIDPEMEVISFEGIDLSIPLTIDEAAFLEETIMSVFNELHKNIGVDLFAESVSVGNTATVNSNQTIIVDSNQTISNSTNLRGGRQLERTHKGIPGPDINYCHYQTGPKKGQWIPGCEFDITLYVCCRCWLCQDDDWTFGWSWVPTNKPTAKPTLSADEQFLLWLDDDGYKARYPMKPTKKPTRKPTNIPTNPPTFPPTKAPIAVKKERSPEQPNIREERPRKPNPFDQEVLKKLKKGRFKRFHNLKNLRFGRGN